MSQNLISKIASELMSESTSDVADVVTFLESSWGPQVNLYPFQKLILKSAYGMELDDSEKTIPIPDMVNDRVLYNFTEKECLQWLYDEGRCNTNDVQGKNFSEIILVAGRRSGKCRSVDDYIATNKGTIRFSELLNRKPHEEDIEIFTYDENGRRSLTSDFCIWDNGVKPCIRITTRSGIKEESSFNHPYFVWRGDKPEWVNLEDVRIGDRIAISRCLPSFNESSGLGDDRAKILGYLCGDGGITSRVGFTSADKDHVDDLRQCIAREFPKYELNSVSGEKYGYSVVKESRRCAQDGSKKNLVKEWLKDINVFGFKAKYKRVPKVIMEGSKSETACFLNRLYACDGYVYQKSKKKKSGKIQGSVAITLASEGFINDVRHLLTKFGISSMIRYKESKFNGKIFDAWEVVINGIDDLLIFKDEIGIFGEKQKKINCLVQALENQAELRGISGSYKGTIPKGVWGYIDQIKEEKGLSDISIIGGHWTGNERLRRQYAPSISKVARYAENLDDDFLRGMAIGDIVWDEVRDVSDCGEKRTVDLCVEGTHVIGGDIVSHNSVLSACISMYEIYKLIKRGDPQDFYNLVPGSPICILNVSPTTEQSGVVYGNICNSISNSIYLKERVLNNTMDYMRLQSDSDKKLGDKVGNVICMTGGCSANSLRGHSAIVVVLDEYAFFVQNAGRFSDEQVYKALTPSTSGFSGDGKRVVVSSPYTKSGHFYNLYRNSFEESETTLMFKVYSAMVNPFNIASADLKIARRRDRVSFSCEFGAEFSDTISQWIDDPQEFKKCITLDNPPYKGKPDVRYYMGIDLGFKNDGTAISIVHKEGNKIILDYADVWFSNSSDVWDDESSDNIYSSCTKYKNREILKMEEVVNEIKELTKWFPIKYGIFDQMSGFGLQELLHKEGLTQFERVVFTDSKNHEVYQCVKSLYSEQLIELWDHEVLVPEILQLEAERRNAKIKVRALNMRGKHDDISDSFVRACWVCNKETVSRPNNKIAGARRGADASCYNSFFIKKRKMHGDHPRGLDKIKRRRR